MGETLNGVQSYRKTAHQRHDGEPTKDSVSTTSSSSYFKLQNSKAETINNPLQFKY